MNKEKYDDVNIEENAPEETTSENNTSEKTISENNTEETTCEKNAEGNTDENTEGNTSGEDVLPILDEDGACAVIEAILFAMGNSVRITKICDVLNMGKKEIKPLLERLQSRYERADSGLELVCFEDSIQLCTKSTTFDYLAKIARMPQKYSLTDTMLETLSIVAYKQPVTRAAIEKIRGVNCDHAINKLLEYELIEEVGRLDAPGRPILFGTTEQFLRSFGVKSISDLPTLGPELVEEMKQQAEEEISEIGEKGQVKVEV